MKRLRHPVRAIEEPFGKAGLIVAVLALVLALTGAAFAATGLNGKQKKEVEKIAKKFAGKPGAAGAQGPAGPAGPAGAAGAAGKDGASGTSVTTSSFSGKKTVGSVSCEEGGVEVKSASPATAVCNGAAAAGGGGLPETLGSGETETGTWSVQAHDEGETGFTFLSFPIPLAFGLDKDHVVYLKEGEEETEQCPGTAAAPEAKKGFLCVYSTVVTLVPFESGAIADPSKAPGTPGSSSAGALLLLTNTNSEPGFGYGTWAVTAP